MEAGVGLLVGGAGIVVVLAGTQLRLSAWRRTACTGRRGCRLGMTIASKPASARTLPHAVGERGGARCFERRCRPSGVMLFKGRQSALRWRAGFPDRVSRLGTRARVGASVSMISTRPPMRADGQAARRSPCRSRRCRALPRSARPHRLGPRRNPVMTSSKISSAPVSSHACRRPSKKTGLWRHRGPCSPPQARRPPQRPDRPTAGTTL